MIWLAGATLCLLPFTALRYVSPFNFRTGPVFWAACTGIFAHQIFSLLNYLAGPFFFTALDPYYLNKSATIIAGFPDAIAWSVGSEFYVKWLATFYHIFGPDIPRIYDTEMLLRAASGDYLVSSFGPHIILGQSLTVLAFSFNIIVLLWFFDWLDVGNSAWAVFGVLVWTLLPAELIYGSVTAREAFMALAVMLATASFWWLFQNNRLWLFWLGAFWLCVMGLFHQIMLVYAVFAIIIIGLFWLFQSNQLQPRIKLMLVAMVGIAGLLMLAGLLYLPVPQGEYYVDMLKGSWVDAIRAYRGWVNDSAPNTHYLIEGEFSGWLSSVGDLILSYAFYLLGPFHGDVGSVSTWVLLLQALIRWLGIPLMILLCLRDKKYVLLALVYFSLSFTWSIGTTNHGQAFRHHVMTDWILILTTVVYVTRFARFKPARVE
jgi:hypothetical protein